jgi:chemotaxis signal transduction protein
MSESTTEFEADDFADSGDVVEFLHVRLDGVRYALELGWVGQVVRRPTVTRVPRSPPGIYGSTTVEGDVVVAVDTYELFGLDRPFDSPRDAHFVVLDGDETPQPMGLLVEVVDGIERHHIDDISPLGENDSPLEDHWFRASLEVDETRVQVFEGHRIVSELLPFE